MKTFCMPMLAPQPLRCEKPSPAPVMKRVPLVDAAPVGLTRPQPKPGVTNRAKVKSPFLITSATGTPALNERRPRFCGLAQPKSPRALMVTRLASFPSPSAQAPRFVSAFRPSIMLLFDPWPLGLKKPRLPPSEKPLTGIEIDAPKELKPAPLSERWPYCPATE